MLEGSTTNGTSPVPLLMQLNKTLAFAVHCSVDQSIILALLDASPVHPGSWLRNLFLGAFSSCLYLYFSTSQNTVLARLQLDIECIVVTAKDGL